MATAGTGEASICVVGSLNKDISVSTPTFPLPGETVIGNTVHTSAGGKGLNQARAARRAGGEVSLVGTVGADEDGAHLISELASRGIDVSGVRRAEEATGLAVVLVDASGENCIIVVPGANAAKVSLDAADRDRIAHADVLLMQLEIPVAQVIDAARVAREVGTTVILNAAPMTSLPHELTELIDVLIVNEHEDRELDENVRSAIAHVVTTYGARAATYRGPDGQELSVVPPTVDVVDSTGAGDAFVGAFAVAWARGHDPRLSLQHACAAGALAVRNQGADNPGVDRDVIADLATRTYGAPTIS